MDNGKLFLKNNNIDAEDNENNINGNNDVNEILIMEIMVRIKIMKKPYPRRSEMWTPWTLLQAPARECEPA